MHFHGYICIFRHSLARCKHFCTHYLVGVWHCKIWRSTTFKGWLCFRKCRLGRLESPWNANCTEFLPHRYLHEESSMDKSQFAFFSTPTTICKAMPVPQPPAEAQMHDLFAISLENVRKQKYPAGSEQKLPAVRSQRVLGIPQQGCLPPSSCRSGAGCFWVQSSHVTKCCSVQCSCSEFHFPMILHSFVPSCFHPTAPKLIISIQCPLGTLGSQLTEDVSLLPYGFLFERCFVFLGHPKPANTAPLCVCVVPFGLCKDWLKLWFSQ